MPKGKNLLEKTCHCYYQATETNACVCECKIVEEESEMRTKKPLLTYYDAKKQQIQNL
jgi:hypothetical protein